MADVKAGGDSLFNELNQGVAITKLLKPGKHTYSVKLNSHIVDKMKTEGEKAAIFELDARKWKIEHQRNKQDIVLENREMHNVAYFYDCEDCVFKIHGKINSITVDSCSRCAVNIEDVVASVEFINCKKMNVQVLGKVPTIALDKCSACQLSINKNSLGVEILTSNSSEVNVLLPKEEGDYEEHAIPELFKTTIAETGKALVSTCVQK